MANAPEYIIPDWPAANNIRAVFTTRSGGYSQAPWCGFNLGLHVGDDAQHVAANRQLLIDSLSLPQSPMYLNQVHGTEVLRVDNSSPNNTTVPAYDACWSESEKSVIAIMTADCLPVLFSSKCGSVIAGAHAGWRGLADGVIENTVTALPVAASQLCAWLGPAIGPLKFEVGAEVRECFMGFDQNSSTHFTKAAGSPNKYLADLYGLARDRLASMGVTSIYGGDACTHSDENRFFSHRRDQGSTGRMAALIWKA